MTNKIIFLQSTSLGEDVDVSYFKDLGNISFYGDVNQEDICEICKDATIIITNKNIFGKKEMDQLPLLKLICVTATGVNNIDTAYAKKKGIKVCNVSGYSTTSVSQHTLALALALNNNIYKYDKYVKDNSYSLSHKFTYFNEIFHDFTSLKWGIVGLGNIGRKVALLAKTLGADVSYYSTSSYKREEEYPAVDFKTLLKQSDIISIHAPLNDNTYHLFNEEAFSLMKKDAIIINVARGSLIDEKALIHALKENKIKGAGLDVFEEEPININNELLKMDNVILTPHSAWGSVEARKQLAKEVYENIKAYLNGNERNVIN